MKTAEAVSRGHVDKVCDQISDAILDECLKQDRDSRVAIETTGGHGSIFIVGEVTTKAHFDEREIAKKVYAEIGYKDKVDISSNIVMQSPDIACGVDSGGAGDQGIMIGYACNENEALIPQELYLARQIIEKLPSGFGPDAKSQVTLSTRGNIDTIIISAQHGKDCDLSPLNKLAESFNPKRFFINPTGSFLIAGFQSDSGTTGRKIVQDAYGPRVAVGGGAFSGKDGTKVDRSAAYMARKIAVDYLKKYSAREILVEIAYSIGVADPVMAQARIDGRIRKVNEYDLRPRAIIEQLQLKKPIFYETAQNGHFGHGFLWDK